MVIDKVTVAIIAYNSNQGVLEPCQDFTEKRWFPKPGSFRSQGSPGRIFLGSLPPKQTGLVSGPNPGVWFLV